MSLLNRKLFALPHVFLLFSRGSLCVCEYEKGQIIAPRVIIDAAATIARRVQFEAAPHDYRAICHEERCHSTG